MPVRPDDLGKLSERSQAKGRAKYNTVRDAFLIKFSGAFKADIQVSVKKAIGSMDLAERIAELCYEQLELGASKAEVSVLRDAFLRQCHGGDAPKLPKPKPLLQPKEEVVERSENPKATAAPSVQPPQPAKAPGVELSSIKEALTANVEIAVDDDVALAAVAAASALEDELGLLFADAPAPETDAPAEAPTEAAPAEAAADEAEPEVQEDAPASKGRKKRMWHNHGRIEGRDSRLPNASINGTYLVKSKHELFHGRPCWEKVQVGKEERRVLFFSNPQFMWKISNRYDDLAQVFAFARADDVTRMAPSEHLRWYVFDGRDHYEDEKVRWVELEAEDEEPERKRKKTSESKPPEPSKEKETTPLELATRHLQQCLEMKAAAEELRAEGILDDAAVVYGRQATKKNYQINGIYMLRPGKYHGAACFQKVSGDPKAGKKYLLYSATKQSWKITDKIQDQDSYAFAKVEDRGKQTPPEFPKGFLTWKVFCGKQAGYKKDEQVFCTRVDIPSLEAAAKAADKEVEALRAREEQNTRRLAEKASDDRVAAAAAAAQQQNLAAGRGTEAIAEEVEGETEAEQEDDMGESHLAALKSDERVAEALARAGFIRPPAPAVNGNGQVRAAAGSSTDQGDDLGKTTAKVRRIDDEPMRRRPPAITINVLQSDDPESRATKQEKKFRGKACPKMLVRSALRCSCCFRLQSECQAAKKAEANGSSG